MELLPRSSWGGPPAPAGQPSMKRVLDRIFIHWPVMPAQMSDHHMLQSAHRYHTGTLGWSDIGYSFGVGMDGQAYDLRGIGVAGGHTRTENDDSYGIVALLGEDELPTPELLLGIKEVIEHIRLNHDSRGPLDSSDIVVMGHRHDLQVDGAGTNTACPGEELADWAWAYVHGRDYVVAEHGAPPVAMSFTEATQFLGDLYVLLIGKPDTVGFNYWRDQLMKGEAKRSDVVYAFADVLGRAGQ